MCGITLVLKIGDVARSYHLFSFLRAINKRSHSHLVYKNNGNVCFDTFALVMNFNDEHWVPKHVTIGLFKAPNTIGATIAELVKPLLGKFQLMDKAIAYVKDENFNLNTLATTLSSMITCALL